MSDLTPLDDKIARHRGAPTSMLASAIGRIHLCRGEVDQALSMFQKAQALGASTAHDAAHVFSLQLERFLEDRATEDDVALAADSIMKRFPDEHRIRAYVGVNLTDAAEAGKLVTVAKRNVGAALEWAGHLREPERSVIVTKLRTARALLVEHYREAAFLARRASLPRGWEWDGKRLEELALWCFRHEVHLDAAATTASA